MNGKFLKFLMISLILLGGVAFVAADDDKGDKCFDYTKDGVAEKHCATCGDNICEEFEKCTPSVCEDGACTDDCGGLYCPEDCEKSCEDSDGGEDFYTRGEVTGLESPGEWDTWRDYCGVSGEEEGKLVEYVCGPDNYGEKVLYECPNGCEDGACIDSGSGEDYPVVDLLVPTIEGKTVEQNGVAYPRCGELDLEWCKEENPSADDDGPFEFKWGDGSVSCSWFPAKHTYKEYGKYAIFVRVKNTCGFISERSSEVNVYEKIREQVKCVFRGAASNVPQECYSEKGGCKSEIYDGHGACVVDVYGYKGEQVVWKSTCGGYAYTVIDGENEYAEFECDNVCTDSDGGKNYYVKGTACEQNGNLECATDSCDGDVLVEFYCDDGDLDEQEYECPNGCSDGACISETNNGFSLNVKTNKHLYRPDETVTITATVSGKAGSNIEEAKVTAILSGPWAEEIAYNVDLEKVACREACPACPVVKCVKEPCPLVNCPPCTRTCIFEGRYTPPQAGLYEITATATLGGITKKAYAKFTVSKQPQGIYVRLGEKFSLAEGGSAKVVDYRYMKITLVDIEDIACIPEAECLPRVRVQVETPCDIFLEVDADEETHPSCTGSLTIIEMSEGESRDVFGAKLTFLQLVNGYATFVVQKPQEADLVDVEIFPKEQTIRYGEAATYSVRVRDKHPLPTCLQPTSEELCDIWLMPFTYLIHIRNLPFSKEYPVEIVIPPGGEKTFELAVKPYDLIERPASPAETMPSEAAVSSVTGRATAAVSKPAKRLKPVSVEAAPAQAVTAVRSGKGSSGVAEKAEVAEVVVERPMVRAVPIPIPPPDLMRRYKFSVTAMLKNNPAVQDTATAVLSIKPHLPPPPPPPFPGEKISIKLYRGWNLITLPGKLIKFDKESLARRNQKLIGFVYIKEEQKYYSLQEAERKLGSRLKEYLAKNAFWIYSRSPMTLNIWVDRKISYEDLSLVKGWNLVPITEDMLGGYLTDILGDCKLEKIYLWDAAGQRWNKISPDYIFPDELFSYGFAAKSSDYCRLNGPEIIEPPPMPE
jgi:hypothetical protein